eukprot:CAMPEP_0117046724 /NCGR_PEP_ID=MMETSP0472-20121206/32308_1 /TAXON_ID=693140 ORGANISM="Tiarina fusus, Strain LIS" /NCGR_SAMPLE_ID=MMETSP0472 /ASSEMBLY_ACC=CAM_ASM_000603 /LENGTH=228 /DNA_ID=CAMNT_0004759187 /DNA_START=56 /DNA_END=739 /DNA_ORIENTATION=+
MPAPYCTPPVLYSDMERVEFNSSERVRPSNIRMGVTSSSSPTLASRRASASEFVTHRSSSSTELKACEEELVHMSLQGTHGLGGLNSMKVDSTSSSYTQGWEISGNTDALRGKACLRDANGEVLAVVVRRPASGYEVLCPTPAYAGQKAHKLVSKSKILFKWATIKQDKLFSSTYTITDEATKAVYTTKERGPWFKARSVQILDCESGKPCALFRQKFDNGAVSRPVW